MAKKHWMGVALAEQAEKEDVETGDMLRRVAKALSKCSSNTIFDVAWKNYERLCEKDRKEGQDWQKREKPKVVEYVEWRGDGDHEGPLAVVGLAKCKRIQCPLCCYSRSFLRRNAAIEWAKSYDWSDYYVVSLTFTVPHKLLDSATTRGFKGVLDNLNKSLSAFSKWVVDIQRDRARGYKSPFPDSIGFISSLECTFGANGLHPHFHAIFFTKAESDVEKLRQWFRKDRVRVWKKSGGSLLRMPDINEDLSFQVLVKPQEKVGPERIISYINKGLFETISVDQKDKTWSKTSKNIFHLSPTELKYFCVFFEATRGMRFYRSGGICKQIKGISEQVKAWEEGSEEDIINRELKIIFRIANKNKDFPEFWISEYVKRYQRDLEKKALDLSSDEIKKLVRNSWKSFLKEKMENRQKYFDEKFK